MKLITSPPAVDNLVAAVNDNLPPDIRVWNIVCYFSLVTPANLDSPYSHSYASKTPLTPGREYLKKD